MFDSADEPALRSVGGHHERTRRSGRSPSRKTSALRHVDYPLQRKRLAPEKDTTALSRLAQNSLAKAEITACSQILVQFLNDITLQARRRSYNRQAARAVTSLKVASSSQRRRPTNSWRKYRNVQSGRRSGCRPFAGKRSAPRMRCLRESTNATCFHGPLTGVRFGSQMAHRHGLPAVDPTFQLYLRSTVTKLRA